MTMIVTKRDRKMLARLHARAAILKARITAGVLRDVSDSVAELNALEWAIIKLTGVAP